MSDLDRTPTQIFKKSIGLQPRQDVEVVLGAELISVQYLKETGATLFYRADPTIDAVQIIIMHLVASGGTLPAMAANVSLMHLNSILMGQTHFSAFHEQLHK